MGSSLTNLHQLGKAYFDRDGSRILLPGNTIHHLLGLDCHTAAFVFVFLDHKSHCRIAMAAIRKIHHVLEQ